MKRLAYTDFVKYKREFYKRKEKYDKIIDWIDIHITFEPINYFLHEIVSLFFPLHWTNPLYSDYYYLSPESNSNKKITILGRPHIIKGIAVTLHGKYFILEDGSFIDCKTPYEYR